MIFDQIVHKNIRLNVSPHQTCRVNVCPLWLEGPKSFQPSAFGERISHRWEEISPRLQTGRLQPADITGKIKYLNSLEGFSELFHRNNLKSKNHFNLFWDLCCVILALKESKNVADISLLLFMKDWFVFLVTFLVTWSGLEFC